MKYQKQSLLFIICSITMLTAKAQLSIFGGPQITSAKYLIREEEQATKSKQGFTAGVGLKWNVEGPIYFSPTLSYTQKGYDVTFTQRAFPPDSLAKNNSTSLNTLEFAPLLQINFSKQKSYLFLRVGPALDFNLSGTEKFDTAANKTVSRAMSFSFGDYSFATTSINAHFGYQHKSGLTLFAHGTYGIGSLNNADYGPSIFHRAAGVSLGWKFGKRK